MAAPTSCSMQMAASAVMVGAVASRLLRASNASPVTLPESVCGQPGLFSSHCIVKLCVWQLHTLSPIDQALTTHSTTWTPRLCTTAVLWANNHPQVCEEKRQLQRQTI